MTLAGNERAHQPVMADEVVRWLVTDRRAAYIDLTVGSGGHLSRLALAVDSAARLYGVDRDPVAVAGARRNLERLVPKAIVVHASYADLAEIAARLGERVFHGILLDLGISSAQLDDAERGFAFRLEGPLDMRFDPRSTPVSAADLVNTANEEELADIIDRFGQERLARRLATGIVRERRTKVIRTTTDLRNVIARIVGERHRNKSLARVFQALRIAVNGELACLQRVLPLTLNYLAEGGRLAVISYHSLEDRLVKQFLATESRDCLCPPRVPQCVCGHRASLRLVTRRAIRPSLSEVAANPRARSARLRVGEKLAV